jgi:hypothetical protein
MRHRNPVLSDCLLYYLFARFQIFLFHFFRIGISLFFHCLRCSYFDKYYPEKKKGMAAAAFNTGIQKP